MEGKESVKNKKPSLGKIIGLAAVVVIVLFYIGCQVYITTNKNTVTTEIAIAASEKKTLSVEVFVVRDEQIITASASSVVSCVSDGTRVGVNDTVAYSFNDSTSAGNVIRMDEISQEIDYYTALVNQSASVTDDTTSYDNRIMNDIIAFSAMVDSGDFSSLDSKKDELRDAITSKQTATGVELDISDKVAQLRAEYSSLKSQTGSYSEIKSGGTGYYISGVDGYESVLSYSDVDNWTIEQVNAALDAEPNAVASNQIGRLVHGYYWYLACVVDTGSINSLREGNRRTVTFPDSSVDDITATVYMIRSDAASGKSLLVFKCNTMNADLSTLRKEHAVVILEEISGYRVDNRALRTNDDNDLGVYVVKGSVMRFKKVEIACSGDDYSIVTTPFLREDEEDMKNTSKSSYIGIYDEYIVTGQDLYDGKIIS